MRMKCEVIKDLMPSYIDNLLSEDSQDLVEEHLAECETCKAYYETLKGDDDIFEAAAEELHVDEIQPLKKIKKKMNRKTLIVSLISVLCAAVVGYGVFFAMVHIDSYVPYEEAGIRVTEDGNMYVDEEYYSTWGYTDSNRRIKFIYFTDSFVTKTADHTEEEKNQIRDHFSRSNDTTYSSDDETYKPAELDEVYYLAEEYAEKFKDRNYLLNLSMEEEDRIYEEMKAASVLLWERPEVMDKTGTLKVRFTAKVESVIDDPNVEGGAPRHVVARVFQSAPILFDAGLALGKELEVGKSYTFNMELAMTEKPAEEYSLETLISLYDLRLESFTAVEEELTGVNSVDIQYTPF